MGIVIHIAEAIETVFILNVMVLSAISSLILGVRLRRRIKKTLGIDVRDERELTSLKTWMTLQNVEERNRGGRLG